MFKPSWFFVIVDFLLLYHLTLAEVKETQRAECTIISGDVRATAEATISQKLEGFCATDHLSQAFGNLEHRLLNEINHLRAMINLLLPPLYQQHYFAQPKPQLYQPLLPLSTISLNATNDSKPSGESDQMQNESPINISSAMDSTAAFSSSSSSIDQLNLIEVTTLPMRDTTETITEKQLKFKPVQKKTGDRFRQMQSRAKTGPREFEIHKFNNTILSGADLQIYTYYWKIEQFSGKLASNVTTLTSPIFSIAGFYLQVKASFNHMYRDYLYLQLERIDADSGLVESSIVLNTGDMFKKIEAKVAFKHKIIILDQVTPANDLVSQEFDNTNQGFLIPNSAILSGPYAKGDNLLIKVVMTL